VKNVTRLALSVASLTLFTAACSSSDSDKPSPTDSGTPSTTTDGGPQVGQDGSVVPETDGGAPSVDASKACADVADAICAKLATCSKFALDVTYGDVAKCKERAVINCAESFSAPGTSATPAKAEACAQSLGSLACDDFLTGKLGAACTPAAGALTEGASCTEDAQCASTFCARAPTAACGKCAAITTPGSACVNESCSRGLACPKGTTSCVVPVRGKVGDACAKLEDCDVATGVGCNTLSKKCIQLTVSDPGTSCGAPSISATTFGVCRASGSCSSNLNGTCNAPAAADDATCSTADTGPKCLPPARCVGTKCTVTAPTSCK
jgi:hypothetical protein